MSVEVSLVTAPDYDTPQEGLDQYCIENNLKSPVYEEVSSESEQSEVTFRVSIPDSNFKAVERSGFDQFHAMYRVAEAFILENQLPIVLPF